MPNGSSHDGDDSAVAAEFPVISNNIGFGYSGGPAEPAPRGASDDRMPPQADALLQARAVTRLQAILADIHGRLAELRRLGRLDRGADARHARTVGILRRLSEPGLSLGAVLRIAEEVRNEAEAFPAILEPAEVKLLDRAIGVARERMGLGPSYNRSSRPPTGPIPVRLYLSDDTDADKVERALADVLESTGVEVVGSDPPVQQSWWRNLRATLRGISESDLAARLLREFDRAVELRAVDQVQAQVDAAQGDAVAKLITALNGTPRALVQIGSVLLVKVDGVPVVRNLTQAELAHLQRNPELFRDPGACLAALQAVADRQVSGGTAQASLSQGG